MADRHCNPFQAIDIRMPVDLNEAVTRHCRAAGNEVIDQNLLVDFWFLAVCVAVRLGLEPAEFSTGKIIPGSIFGSDPWRVQTLMMLTMGHSGAQIASEPRRVLALANGLAVAGVPKVMEMLESGGGDSIWEISDAAVAECCEMSRRRRRFTTKKGTC